MGEKCRERIGHYRTNVFEKLFDTNLGEAGQATAKLQQLHDLLRANERDDYAETNFAKSLYQMKQTIDQQTVKIEKQSAKIIEQNNAIKELELENASIRAIWYNTDEQKVSENPVTLLQEIDELLKISDEKPCYENEQQTKVLRSSMKQ